LFLLTCFVGVITAFSVSFYAVLPATTRSLSFEVSVSDSVSISISSISISIYVSIWMWSSWTCQSSALLFSVWKIFSDVVKILSLGTDEAGIDNTCLAAPAVHQQTSRSLSIIATVFIFSFLIVYRLGQTGNSYSS